MKATTSAFLPAVDLLASAAPKGGRDQAAAAC